MRIVLLAVFAIACGGASKTGGPPSATTAAPPPVSIEDMLRALPANSEVIAVIDYARLRKSPLARELYGMFADRKEVKLIVAGLCAEAFRDLELGVYGGTLTPKVWIGWHMGTTRSQYEACRTSAQHREVAGQLNMIEGERDGVLNTTVGEQTLQYLWTEQRVMNVAMGSAPAPQLTAAQLRAFKRTPQPGVRGVLASPEMADLYAHVNRNAGFWGFVSSADMKSFGLVAASYSFDITEQITASMRMIAIDEAKAIELAGFAKPLVDRYLSAGQLERGDVVVVGRELHVRLLMTRAGLSSLLPQRPLFGP